MKYLEENVAALAVETTSDETIGIRDFLEIDDVAEYRSTPSSEYFAFVTIKTEQ